MADYDAGEITDREQQAADNQTAISKQNARDVLWQLNRQLSNYDLADAQNRALADTQLRQNSRKNSADRFEAQRDLQASTLGLLGSMGTALNGSSAGNLSGMLESRNDKDNNTFWAQHQANQDAVENSYSDSLNQNVIARRDAQQSAEKAIKDIEGDWRANMNNINPNLFPGADTTIGSDESVSPGTAWDEQRASRNNATISGYLIPDQGMRAGLPTQVTANRQLPRGNDYFSQMMRRFSGR